MLGKLLKYDLKFVYKVVAVFYVLAFIFSVIGRGLGEIENSLVFDVTSKIFLGIAVAMMVNSLINSLMRLWARFVRNIYKDESYLTHTLPVEKKDIYASKVISGIVCIFTTMIVAVVCLGICYYSEANMEVLKNLLELAASTYNTTVLKLLLLTIVVIFLEVVYILLTGYVGIILGHKSNTGKMVKSIVIAFALYLAFQTLTLGLMGIYGLFNPDIMNLLNTTDIINIEAIKSVMYAGIGVYVIYSVILYYLGQIELNKGVNVE